MDKNEVVDALRDIEATLYRVKADWPGSVSSSDPVWQALDTVWHSLYQGDE